VRAVRRTEYAGRKRVRKRVTDPTVALTSITRIDETVATKQPTRARPADLTTLVALQDERRAPDIELADSCAIFEAGLDGDLAQSLMPLLFPVDEFLFRHLVLSHESGREFAKLFGE